jgi:hypothetical protein
MSLISSVSRRCVVTVRSVACCSGRALSSAAAPPAKRLTDPQEVSSCMRASLFSPSAASGQSIQRSGTCDIDMQIAYPANVHRSNAQELISRVPVIEVDGMVAMCDGGGV